MRKTILKLTHNLNNKINIMSTKQRIHCFTRLIQRKRHQRINLEVQNVNVSCRYKFFFIIIQKKYTDAKKNHNDTQPKNSRLSAFHYTLPCRGPKMFYPQLSTV